MDNFMIGFILLLGTVFISRSINEKAIQKLEVEQKAALIDLFSKDRLFTFGLLIAIIVLFFLSIKFNWIDRLYSYILYTFSILVFLVITNYSSYKKLKENGFPDDYIRSYTLSATIRFVGMMVFLALTAK